MSFTKARLPSPYRTVMPRPPICIPARGVKIFQQKNPVVQEDLGFDQLERLPVAHESHVIKFLGVAVLFAGSFLAGRVTQPADHSPIVPVSGKVAETLDRSIANTEPGDQYGNVAPALQIAGRAFLKSFAASTMTEKLNMVINPGSVASELTEYYENGKNVDIEFANAVFSLSPTQSTATVRQGLVAMTKAPKRNDTPLTIFFKIANYDPLDLKLDWATYVQEKHSRLEEFLSSPTMGPAVFQLNLMRTHLFESEDSGKIGIKITSLSGKGFDEVLKLDADDQYFNGLISDLPWSKVAQAKVKLEWVRSSINTHHIALKEFYCWGFPLITERPLSGTMMQSVTLNHLTSQ